MAGRGRKAAKTYTSSYVIVFMIMLQVFSCTVLISVYFYMLRAWLIIHTAWPVRGFLDF
jgi:hypothetical protein